MVRFLFKARINPLNLRKAAKTIITSDPPTHTPIRQTVNRGFTPRRVAAWEARVRELSEEYVRGVKDATTFDVIQTVASPLPTTIIAEMLGVDSARIGDFRRWSASVIEVISGSTRDNSPGQSLKTGGELFEYLRTVVEARRKEPADDLISVLIDPKHEDVLDAQGVMFFVLVLLIAGNETTTNAVGSAVSTLIRNRDVLDEVTKDPNLIPQLVEEVIRMESPIRFVPRTATEDTTIRGTRVPKGSNLLIMIGAANRDERRFEDPDRFDLHRDTSGHLGFGHGIHFCLGASLARLESRIILETLLPHLEGRTLLSNGVEHADSFFTRGYARLEVSRIGESVTSTAA
jgi:cytochrome P450